MSYASILKLKITKITKIKKKENKKRSFNSQLVTINSTYLLQKIPCFFISRIGQVNCQIILKKH